MLSPLTVALQQLSARGVMQRTADPPTVVTMTAGHIRRLALPVLSLAQAHGERLVDRHSRANRRRAERSARVRTWRAELDDRTQRSTATLVRRVQPFARRRLVLAIDAILAGRDPEMRGLVAIVSRHAMAPGSPEVMDTIRALVGALDERRQLDALVSELSLDAQVRTVTLALVAEQRAIGECDRSRRWRQRVDGDVCDLATSRFAHQAPVHAPPQTPQACPLRGCAREIAA